MAETLLGDARLSLAEVAERLGFSDLSSFSQAFALVRRAAGRVSQRGATGRQPFLNHGTIAGMPADIPITRDFA